MARKPKVLEKTENGEVPRYQIGWAEKNAQGDYSPVKDIDATKSVCVYCGVKLMILNCARATTQVYGINDRVYFFYYHSFCAKEPTKAERFNTVQKLSELIEAEEAKLEPADIEIDPRKMLMN